MLAFLFLPLAAATLSSGNTNLILEASPAAPRITTLSLNGGPSWQSNNPEALVDHIEINHAATPIRWQLQPSRSVVNKSLVRFVYDSPTPHLRLSWEWEVRSSPGPIEHSIRIENLAQTEIWIPLQNSFSANFQVPAQQSLTRFWVEKGASSPSPEGTHADLFRAGDAWEGTSSNYAHPRKGQPREMIPYLLVQRDDSKESGWYVGIEFSGRTQISLSRHADSIFASAGLNPLPGPFLTRLAPGETFETPRIFIGAFAGGPDGAGNALRRWIRKALNNPLTLTELKYPLLVSNSWGSGMAINEEQAHRMIDDASALGMEMFHLDAGWFRSLGDWVSNPQKFPHGVEAVSAYAHKLGLKFGLWTDWTQAGISKEPGALDVYDPKVRDWLTTDPPPGWKQEEFKGITIDIGVPQVHQWAATKAATIVSQFQVDMLEHDGYLVAEGCDRANHPHAALDESTAKHFMDEGFPWVEGSDSTDVSYRSTRAYYQIQTALRHQFPHLLLEVCNDGGRMVDFGSAAHGDYFSITDAYDPLSNRRAVYDASYVLPQAMLETYVEKWPTPTLENFRYMLRSGMMGWFTLMQDSTTWTPAQHDAAREEFAVYKAKLRPLIRNADVYHVSNRPDGEHWDAMEYVDKSARNGVLYAFRGSNQYEDTHRFQLRGLNQKASYKMQFQDQSSPDYADSGEHLTQEGVTVSLKSPNSSELVFFNEVR